MGVLLEIYWIFLECLFYEHLWMTDFKLPKSNLSCFTENMQQLQRAIR